MAKYERMVNGDFHTILDRLEQAVLHGSASASYEDGSDYSQGGFRCAVRVYERYSWTGGNRVSLTLTVAGCQGQYLVSAITAGGSQGAVYEAEHHGGKRVSGYHHRGAGLPVMAKYKRLLVIFQQPLLIR